MTTCLRLAQSESGILVEIVGRGTMQDSPAFRDLVSNCLKICDGQLHADLSTCEFLDSTFLGCLIQLHKQWNQKPDERFLLVASQEKKRELFKASFYDRLLLFVDEAPDPLAGFKEISRECLDAEEFGKHILECHEQLINHGGDDTSHYREIVDRLTIELEKK